MGTTPQKTKPPVLATIGNRTISTRGYSFEALKVHLLEHKKEEWCQLDCCTRVFFQRASGTNRDEMRDRLGKANRNFLRAGYLLLKQLTGRFGSVEAIKIFDKSVPEDRLHAKLQLEKLAQRGDTSQEVLNQMYHLLGGDSTDAPSSEQSVPPPAA